MLAAFRDVVERLARTEELKIAAGSTESAAATRDASVAVDPAFEAAVRLGAADLAAEQARLTKQLEKEVQRLTSLEQRLGDERFTARAAPEKVEAARAEAAKAQTTIAAIRERLSSLNGG